MTTRRQRLLGLLSIGCAIWSTAVALAQPGTCGCSGGTPCASTQCLRPCYTCCNNNCTNMTCCQDWCDGRGLTCNEPPDSEGQPGNPGN
jgi:hypothetical protein